MSPPASAVGGGAPLVGVLRPDLDYQPLVGELEVEIKVGFVGFAVLEPVAIDPDNHQILRFAAIVLRSGKYIVTPQGDGWLAIDLYEDRIPTIAELNAVIEDYEQTHKPIYAPTTRPPIIYP